ncbi:UDP-N-acetylglucosamine 2-epimerase (non-hydrolyzing) [Patescibacteria group bacterium]|nr:UDP-N-acetylglucosamine 2-epimerase (non-hydrolyzing) [Patescibacteria group bacterium]
MKLSFVLGTRPEIIKLYSLLQECQKRDSTYFVIHTNQHYDQNMDKIFFKDLELDYPKYNLGIGSGQPGDQTGRMLIGIEPVLLREKPDIMIVQGDTNSTLAGALAAVKLQIPVAHVEAGLRSYDPLMPEEHSRVMTDHISSYLFCPTTKQADIAKQEGIAPKKIFTTGNTIVDALQQCSKLAQEKSQILSELNISPGNYFVLTCHRPSNTDNIHNFTNIIEAIDHIAQTENKTCIFPLHPRLKSQQKLINKFKNIKVTEPVGYLDMLQLLNNTSFVFTDSGGIQEEACILQKKCLILRLNTERPETLNVGGAVLLDKISPEDIIDKYNSLQSKKVEWSNPFGDGQAFKKIINVLTK